MSTDTVGRIRGYITADAICKYIKKSWDLTAENNVTRSNISSIKKITWDYLVNEHSEDSEYWYADTGIIKFCYYFRQSATPTYGLDVGECLHLVFLVLNVFFYCLHRTFANRTYKITQTPKIWLPVIVI